MQDLLVEPQTLPQLPPPGFFEHWLLESPHIPAAVVFIVGCVVWMMLRHRQRTRRIAIGAFLACAALAAGLVVIGTKTITDREQLRDRSRQLVQSVADTNPQALRSMLDDRVRLKSIFASSEGADQLVSLATTRNPGVVRSAEVKKVNAGVFGPQVARTQIRVRTKGDMLPSLSWWQIDWTRPDESSEAWVATHIEPLWVQGIPNPAGK